ESSAVLVVRAQRRAAAVSVRESPHQGLVEGRAGDARRALRVAAGVAQAEGVAQLVAEDLFAVLVPVALQEAAGPVLDDDVALGDAVEGVAVEDAGAVRAVAAGGQDAALAADEGARDLVLRVVPADGVSAVAGGGTVGRGARVGQVDRR